MNEEDALALIAEAQGHASAKPQGTPHERMEQMWANTDDYGKLIEEGLPEPSFLQTPTLGEELVYENALSLICGHRKHGKSHIATLIALDAVNAGRHVVVMDYENGARRIARRLRDLGANPKVLSRLMRGYTFPKIPDPKGMLMFLEDLATVYPGSVVLVDAFRGYASKTGGGDFNPNDNNAIERVMAPMADVAKSMDLTIIVIDHPNRVTTGDSIYKASNSAAKEQIVDAIYWVNKEDPYGVDQQGAISIKADNDRDGRLPLEPLFFKIGGQGDGKPLYIEKAHALDVGVMARIAKDIHEMLNAKGTEPMNVSAIRSAITGKNEIVATVLPMMYARETINYDAKNRVYFGGAFEGAKI
jgi:hypothetical protein